MNTDRRDRGSIVTGWLVKLVVFIGVIGLMLFDGLSVTAAKVGAEDDASQAASAAQAEWHNSHNVQAAYNAAVASLVSPSERIVASTFSIDPQGTVRLDLRRTTKTLIVAHFGPLKQYREVTVHGEASLPAP